MGGGPDKRSNTERVADELKLFAVEAQRPDMTKEDVAQRAEVYAQRIKQMLEQ